MLFTIRVYEKHPQGLRGFSYPGGARYSIDFVSGRRQ